MSSADLRGTAFYFIAEEREEQGREFSGDCLIKPVAEPTSNIQFPPGIAC